MPTAHNEALKEDIAKTVIMPGDPLRAKYIAEKYLKDYKLVNNVRGMLAYTGYYNNKRVTIMSHGMGNPSAGIYTYELYKFYDVKNIIRIGSAGSISKNVPIRSVILADKSYSESNYAKLQNGSEKKIISSSEILNKKIEDVSKKKKINILKTIIYNSDVFYSDVEDINKIYKDYGCTCIEMESFALFHNAKILNKNAACLLTISNSLITGEELSSYERQTTFDDMIVLALESI